MPNLLVASPDIGSGVGCFHRWLVPAAEHIIDQMRGVPEQLEAKISGSRSPLRSISSSQVSSVEDVAHVDLLAEIAGAFRRLHLDQGDVRKEVDALHSNNELKGLYQRRG
jgi:hypothetical protein